MSIPIIREGALQKADLLEVAKIEIESHGHEFKAVRGRLGMLTENDGLIIMRSFYKQRKCFRSGCMQEEFLSVFVNSHTPRVGNAKLRMPN